MSFVTDMDLSIPRPPEAANPTRLTVPTLGACTRAAPETKVATKKDAPHYKAELALVKTKALPEKVQLLFELVEDPLNDQIISWSSNGSHFMVKDVKKLAVRLDSKQGQTWIAAFENLKRNMNYHNFSKLRAGDERHPFELREALQAGYHVWTEPNFRRGRPDLLSRITSKPSKSKKEGKKGGASAAAANAAAAAKFGPSNFGLGTGDTGEHALDCTGRSTAALAAAGLSLLEAQLGAANAALVAQVAALEAGAVQARADAEARERQGAAELQRTSFAYLEIVRLKDGEIERLRADLHKKRARDEHGEFDGDNCGGRDALGSVPSLPQALETLDGVLERTRSLPLAKRLKPEPLAETSGAAPEGLADGPADGLGYADENAFESLSRTLSTQSAFSAYDDFFTMAQLFAAGTAPRAHSLASLEGFLDLGDVAAPPGEALPTAVSALPEDWGELLGGE